MATSPEYPDLLWMPPKAWTDANRSSVQVVVIHTTEGSEHGSSAEDGASYDQRRTDGTSTHYFHDSNSTVQCVRTEDQAHAARAQGNKRGIQHELCADAADTWNDDYHQAVLRMAAKQCARDAKKWGIPIKKLNPDQVAAGQKGFCGHADITYAFPEDNGTHTDPGKNFPWSSFLAMVEDEGDGVSSADVVQGNKDYDKKYRQGDSPDGVDWWGNATGTSVWTDQYMPNPFRGTKTSAYKVVEDTANGVIEAQKALADLTAQFAALNESLQAHFSGLIEGENEPNG